MELERNSSWACVIIRQPALLEQLTGNLYNWDLCYMAACGLIFSHL